MNLHPTQEMFINIKDWTISMSSDEFPRWREVCEYAMARDITLNEAIVALVNSGLSHQ